jgi:hypothetical protein
MSDRRPRVGEAWLGEVRQVCKRERDATFGKLEFVWIGFRSRVACQLSYL